MGRNEGLGFRVSMYVCMYVCMYTNVYIYICNMYRVPLSPLSLSLDFLVAGLRGLGFRQVKALKDSAFRFERLR